MAKGLGKKAGSTVVWGLMLLLIVGLAGFGIGNFGGSVQSIGSVGDEEIATQTYARALDQALRQRRQQTGDAPSIAAGEGQALAARVRRQVITRAALDNEAHRRGISIGDDRVADRLRGIGAFRGPDGDFDRAAYRSALQGVGLSEGEFETDLRDEASRNLLQRAVTSGLRVPDAYVRTIVDYVAERRSFTTLRLTPDDLDGEKPQPTDAELRSYYQANIDRFTVPETRQITYAWLTPKMMQSSVEVSDAALHKAYKARADEFRKPARRQVDRLVFPDKAAAQTARDAIASGEKSFEAVVEGRGLSLADTDLGAVTRDDLGEAADGVFALDEPGITGPLPSDLGPALYRVNAILAAQETSFEDARPALRRDLAAERAQGAVDDRIEEVQNKLAAGATLEDLADETPLALGEIDYTGESRDGIAGDAAFREAASTVTADDFPEVTTLSEGGFFALRLDGTVPPRERPLSEVRDRAVEGWQENAVLDRLEEQAGKLRDEVASGTAMSALDHPLSTRSKLTRGEVTPEALSKVVFDLAKGKLAVARAAGAVYLVRTDAVLPPDPDRTDRLAGALRSQARQGLTGDAFELYARALTARAGLKLNQTAINAVHSQMP